MPRIQPLPWSTYANHPLQAKMTRRMAPKLRDSLESSLPSYMVPSAFVMLESLPLTANGKVDRRALPKPEWYLTQRRGTYVEPGNDAQRRIAEIWARLLGADQVGISDNFFDLGGHSLLATQVVSRIREAFGVDLQLRQLFDMPTVRELAEHIEGLAWIRSERPLEDASGGVEREEGLL
jgi:acyl carrier protein